MWEFLVENGERLAYGIIVGAPMGWAACTKYMLSRLEAALAELKEDRDEWKDRYLKAIESS